MASPDGLPWRCPRCKGALAGGNEAMRCAPCDAAYPVIGGVVDLRLAELCRFDLEADRARVRALLDAEEPSDAAALVRRVYAAREGWGADLVELRTGQVVRAPKRLMADLDGWLAEIVPADGRFLDLGCGPGMLLAAAARRGRAGLGVDLSLEWLVVAHRLVAEYGGAPLLAAGTGEALPLADGALGAVVGLDVIEHVADPARVLREIDRVLRPGGALALTTPNRFSLTPEPHVFVWGVGWLPRAWQARYVRWRSGKAYDDTRLMSSWGLARLIRAQSRLVPRVVIPPVDPADARGSRLRAALIRLYNALAGAAPVRPMFLLIGPFFRVLARKPDRDAYQ